MSDGVTILTDEQRRGSPPQNVPFWVGACFMASGALFAVGCIIVVGTACSMTVRRVVESTGTQLKEIQREEICWYVAGTATALIGGAAGMVAFRALWQHDPLLRSRGGSRLYSVFLVRIGYALVLLATLNFVALAALAYIGQLDLILSASFIPIATESTTQPSTQPTEGAVANQTYRLLLMLFAPGLAALGALFFTANSLREKRSSLGKIMSAAKVPRAENSGAEGNIAAVADNRPPTNGEPSRESGAEPPSGTVDAVEPSPVQVLDRTAASKQTVVEQPELAGPLMLTKTQTETETFEDFDSDEFWGGLWFRMGEALLFTLVLFLAAAWAAGRGGSFLLLLSLLLGMFVKTGETLIAGLALKLFKAAETVVK